MAEGSSRIRIESQRDQDFETRVRLLSDALAQLSREIAMSILDSRS